MIATYITSSLSRGGVDFNGENWQFAPSAEVPGDTAIKSPREAIEPNERQVAGEVTTKDLINREAQKKKEK